MLNRKLNEKKTINNLVREETAGRVNVSEYRINKLTQLHHDTKMCIIWPKVIKLKTSIYFVTLPL